jgi:predicted amidohydrolase
MFTKLTKMGAEIFVLPAAWLTLNNSPKEEKELIINNWKLISKARAYDNVSYVITANEVGKTHPILEAIGNSVMFSFMLHLR